MSNQMEDDIERWAQGRLTNWIADTVERFEDIGLSEERAISHATSILLLVSVKMVAGIGVSPQDGGYCFAEALRAVKPAVLNKLRKKNAVRE